MARFCDPRGSIYNYIYELLAFTSNTKNQPTINTCMNWNIN